RRGQRGGPYELAAAAADLRQHRGVRGGGLAVVQRQRRRHRRMGAGHRLALQRGVVGLWRQVGATGQQGQRRQRDDARQAGSKAGKRPRTREGVLAGDGSVCSFVVRVLAAGAALQDRGLEFAQAVELLLAVLRRRLARSALTQRYDRLRSGGTGGLGIALRRGRG